MRIYERGFTFPRPEVNLFSLEDTEINLCSLSLGGIHGFPHLASAVIEGWLPHIKSTQLANVLHGFAPLGSFFRVSEGVADLIFLPLEQYKKDQRVLRGLQKGGMSLARNVGVEAMSLSKYLSDTANVALRFADDILSPEKQALSHFA
eukprot:Pgem_evm2s19129